MRSMPSLHKKQCVGVKLSFDELTLLLVDIENENIYYDFGIKYPQIYNFPVTFRYPF